MNNSRLRELEELDSDGVKLSEQEYAELRELLNMENAEFAKYNQRKICPICEDSACETKSIDCGK